MTTVVDNSVLSPGPLIICLGLFQNTGGPLKSVASFKEALGAKVCCFVNSGAMAGRPIALPEAVTIPSTNLPLLRQFCFPSKSGRTEVEDLGRIAPLISCHSFYRYHIAFTHSMFCRYGTPYWHVPHGILDPYVLGTNRFMKRGFLGVYGHRYLDDAACTIFATRREMEKAESVLGDLRGKVVHWPVSVPSIDLTEERRRALRRTREIPEDALVFLYFGRLHTMKRPLETIQTIAGLRENNVYLVILGPEDGITRSDCETEANRLGFKNLRVLEPVFGPEKSEMVQMCDVFVSLSHRENFNHCAAESLAAGLPVVLSQGNDLGPEISAAGVGWHIAEDTPAAWRSIIEEAVGSGSNKLKEMGRLGRRFVGDHFSFEKFSGRINSLLSIHGKNR